MSNDRFGLPSDPFELGHIQEPLPKAFVDALQDGNAEAFDQLKGIDPGVVVPALSGVLHALALRERDGAAADDRGQGGRGEDHRRDQQVLLLASRYLSNLVNETLKAGYLRLEAVTSLRTLQAAAADEDHGASSTSSSKSRRGRNWSVSVGMSGTSPGECAMRVSGHIASNTRKLEIYRIVEESPVLLPRLLDAVRSLVEKKERGGAEGVDDAVDHALVGHAIATTSAFAHLPEVRAALAETATKVVGPGSILDGPVDQGDEQHLSCLISLLVGALRDDDAADARSSSHDGIPWKEWHDRAMKAPSGQHSSLQPDLPDLRGLLKLVLSVGLLSKTGEVIDGETARILTDMEAFRGHYWGGKSAHKDSPRCIVLDAWGNVLRNLLTGLIDTHRSRMASTQKAIVLRQLEDENAQILAGRTSRDGLTLVGQALKTYGFKWLPIDSEAQQGRGYHPFGARKALRSRDLSGEQMRFLRTLASMDGLMSLESIEYELHHCGFPAGFSVGTKNGLLTWLSQLPPQE